MAERDKLIKDCFEDSANLISLLEVGINWLGIKLGIQVNQINLTFSFAKKFI